MGKLRVFEVNFDGGVDLFKPGDWVRGSVKIVLSERKTDIRGISVIFRGKAKTKWMEYENYGQNQTNCIPYYMKEKYFEEKVLLMGREKIDESGEKVELSAGEHVFPFKFQLPTTTPLPHAFEGKHGHIRYKVKAKIDRPWKFNHTTERLFSVVGIPVDLSMTSGVEAPSEGEDEKTVCCLCCATGPVSASAQTDKSGFVAGENVWVSGLVENNSRRTVVDITAKLVQNVRSRGKRHGSGREHTRNQKTTLAEHKGEGCEGHRSVQFDRTALLIPSCPPSHLKGCDIMEIQYWVEFEADVKRTPYNLTVKLPITIGTIPLKSAYSSLYPPDAAATQQPSAPMPDELPPPSYEIAMGGPQEIPREDGYDYTFGKLIFAPKYPYYGNIGDPAYPPQS